MATHYSILAWRIPWTKEPGGLQSMGSWRVKHDWSDWACTHIDFRHVHINCFYIDIVWKYCIEKDILFWSLGITIQGALCWRTLIGSHSLWCSCIRRWSFFLSVAKAGVASASWHCFLMCLFVVLECPSHTPGSQGHLHTTSHLCLEFGERGNQRRPSW